MEGEIKSFTEDDVETTTKSEFIDDDYDGYSYDIMDDIDEEEELFDYVCSICDNGGELLCCEGRCLRSFHATAEAGAESRCKTLGFSDDQVEAIQNFFCKNCQYKQHQCFSCGELGSSDRSSGAEVFPCVSATCGHFYHPHCVAKLLYLENEAAAEELQKKIASGESFTCPIHKCHVCKQGENKMDPQLQFAVCRRCPKSYHRKCLPRKIAFEDSEDEGLFQRAWDGLIPNRILIYCLKHKIDEDLMTPRRDHLIFPNGETEKRKASMFLSSRDKVVSKKRNLALEDSLGGRTCVKAPRHCEKFYSAMKESDSTTGSEKKPSRLDSSKKAGVMVASRAPLYNSVRSVSMNVNKSSTAGESINSLGERLYTFLSKGSEPVRQATSESEFKQTPTAKPVMKKLSSSPPLDTDSKRRIMALMKDAASSVMPEDSIEKHKVPSTHAYLAKNVLDKSITLGKVEGSIEAVRTALQKLEKGCSIEDAKAVCEPGLLNQIVKWKNKLNVYLAPFLHGMRYTSFGRHFTKVDKLKEIVSMLHWYAQDGDTIVDFCCGANDFNCLMKEKLEETGKKCSYKNYDLLQAKNDFNFEKRDWMSVRPEELPTGSQLIMGLNPPFGVKASLANKFIDKALEFKPKLLILIVPKEAERLDKKNVHYDLVWEDDDLLSGKSFYLPGSIDVYENPMDQWNVNPPPLYLWSRADWTAKHQDIAIKHGHFSRVRKQSHVEREKKLNVAGGHDEWFPCNDGDEIDHENHGRSLDGHPSKPFETHSQLMQFGGEGYRHLGPSISGSHLQFQTVCGGTWANIPDDMARRCTLNSGEYGIHKWLSGANPGPDYGVRNMEEQFPGYRRERTDGLGYRSYVSEIIEKFGNESEIQSPVRVYGQQEPPNSWSQRSFSLAGHSPTYPSIYGHLGSTVESSYASMNTLAGQQYMPQPGFQDDPMGFAPGPHGAFSGHNSSNSFNG